METKMETKIDANTSINVTAALAASIDVVVSNMTERAETDATKRGTADALLPPVSDVLSNAEYLPHAVHMVRAALYTRQNDEARWSMRLSSTMQAFTAHYLNGRTTTTTVPDASDAELNAWLAMRRKLVLLGQQAREQSESATALVSQLGAELLLAAKRLSASEETRIVQDDALARAQQQLTVRIRQVDELQDALAASETETKRLHELLAAVEPSGVMERGPVMIQAVARISRPTRARVARANPLAVATKARPMWK